MPYIRRIQDDLSPLQFSCRSIDYLGQQLKAIRAIVIKFLDCTPCQLKQILGYTLYTYLSSMLY